MNLQSLIVNLFFSILQFCYRVSVLDAPPKHIRVSVNQACRPRHIWKTWATLSIWSSKVITWRKVTERHHCWCSCLCRAPSNFLASARSSFKPLMLPAESLKRRRICHTGPNIFEQIRKTSSTMPNTWAFKVGPWGDKQNTRKTLIILHLEKRGQTQTPSICEFATKSSVFIDRGNRRTLWLHIPNRWRQNIYLFNFALKELLFTRDSILHNTTPIDDIIFTTLMQCWL